MVLYWLLSSRRGFEPAAAGRVIAVQEDDQRVLLARGERRRAIERRPELRRGVGINERIDRRCELVFAGHRGRRQIARHAEQRGSEPRRRNARAEAELLRL